MKAIYSIIILLITTLQLNAQMNSMYSTYGLGVMQLRDNNAFSAMGGVGVAMKSGTTISNLNPASYAGIINEQLMLELSFTGSSVKYISGTENAIGNNLTIDKAALGINLFDNVGTVFGLKKFSTVSYKALQQSELAGAQLYMNDYIEGTGGINLFYIGNGIKLGKHLSLGVTGGYMFGSINRTDEISTQTGYSTVFENNVFYNKLYWNAGIQYDFNVGKSLVTLGGMIQPQMDINRVSDFYIKNTADEILFNDENKTVDKFKYPLQWGTGVTLAKGKSTLSLDMIKQQWKEVNYRGTNFYAQDMTNYALGYKYTKLRSSIYGVMEGLSLMTGLQYENGYLAIRGQQYPSKSFSMGFSVPALNKGLMYSAIFRVGQRGINSGSGFKEQFYDLTFNFGLFSKMNRKGYIYD